VARSSSDRQTVFQTDAMVPRASFDVRAQTRKPVAQMHFQPSGYGITSVGTYVMEFTLETFGQSAFNLQGGPFTVNVLNAGHEDTERAVEGGFSLQGPAALVGGFRISGADFRSRVELVFDQCALP
jgi:hypothetical protein